MKRLTDPRLVPLVFSYLPPLPQLVSYHHRSPSRESILRRLSGDSESILSRLLVDIDMKLTKKTARNRLHEKGAGGGRGRVGGGEGQAPGRPSSGTPRSGNPRKKRKITKVPSPVRPPKLGKNDQIQGVALRLKPFHL